MTISNILICVKLAGPSSEIMSNSESFICNAFWSRENLFCTSSTLNTSFILVKVLSLWLCHLLLRKWSLEHTFSGTILDA